MDLNKEWLSCAGVFVTRSKSGSGFYTDYSFAIRGGGMNQPKISAQLNGVNPLGIVPGQRYQLVGAVVESPVDPKTGKPLVTRDNREIMNLKAAEGCTLAVDAWEANRMGSGDLRIKVDAKGHIAQSSMADAYALHSAEVVAFSARARQQALEAAAPVDAPAPVEANVLT